MGGGSEMLMPISTPATAETGKTDTDANNIVPKRNFFIL
jgi:hypothetical protein